MYTTKQVLEMLVRQNFYEWYNKGNFDTWITGDHPKVSDDQVISDLDEMLKSASK